jgi:chromosome segregation ATPase
MGNLLFGKRGLPCSNTSSAEGANLNLPNRSTKAKSRNRTAQKSCCRRYSKLTTVKLVSPAITAEVSQNKDSQMQTLSNVSKDEQVQNLEDQLAVAQKTLEDWGTYNANQEALIGTLRHELNECNSKLELQKDRLAETPYLKEFAHTTTVSKDEQVQYLEDQLAVAQKTLEDWGTYDANQEAIIGTLRLELKQFGHTILFPKTNKSRIWKTNWLLPKKPWKTGALTMQTKKR